MTVLRWRCRRKTEARHGRARPASPGMPACRSRARSPKPISSPAASPRRIPKGLPLQPGDHIRLRCRPERNAAMVPRSKATSDWLPSSGPFSILSTCCASPSQSRRLRSDCSAQQRSGLRLLRTSWALPKGSRTPGRRPSGLGTPTWALGGVERLAFVAIPEKVRQVIVYGDRGRGRPPAGKGAIT